ncbi:MAG: hypothetical protein IIZ73_09895, partial [Ruminococcus sp.]|nr:hypothetical protein [Ruminococcus sp.]
GVAIAVVEDFPLKVPTPSRSPISLSSLPRLTHSCSCWGDGALNGGAVGKVGGGKKEKKLYEVFTILVFYSIIDIIG